MDVESPEIFLEEEPTEEITPPALFLRLVRVSLGTQSELPVVPTSSQWQALFAQARRQTLVGVLYAGIERLPEGQRPPRPLLRQWFAETERLRRLNRLMNERAAEAHRLFLREGFRNVVLKGQSVARLYPDPLLRTPGDIDLWLEGGRRRVVRWARRRGRVEGLTYCHLHLPLFRDVELEVHFRPSYLHAPLANARLQRWFREMAASQFAHEVELPGGAGLIAAPTAAFDRVFILQHIYRHLFGEGVGLRQLIDYYHVLRQGFDAVEREASVRTLSRLGMTRFSRAVSWIMSDVFGLDGRYLLTPPDARGGRFLLREVLTGGNFGKYDPRIDRTRHDRLIPRVWTSLRRNMRFVRAYPREILWNPVFRTISYLCR